MSKIDVTELAKSLREKIAQLEATEGLEDAGVVIRVGDGVAWVHGLSKAGYSEVLEIETDGGTVEAFALNLMEDEIGAVILGGEEKVKAGASVRRKGAVLDVPVGEELLGRVVDPLGRPLDGGPAIKTKQRGLIERPAIGVMGRKSVHEPLMTGIMSIDAMFPIGRGQARADHRRPPDGKDGDCHRHHDQPGTAKDRRSQRLCGGWTEIIKDCSVG